MISTTDMDLLRRHNTDMKSEMKRLQTYRSWRYSDTQRPGDLANCGLFYTGDQDRVECAFCHGVLKKWQKSDIPWEEHRRHFHRCPFIEGDNVGNIPLLSTPYTNDSYNSEYAASRHLYTNPVLQGHFQNGNVCYDNFYMHNSHPSQYGQYLPTPEPRLHAQPLYPTSVSCLNQTEPHDNELPHQSSELCIINRHEPHYEPMYEAHELRINQSPVTEHISTTQESILPFEQINSSDIVEDDLKMQSCRLRTFKSWPSQLSQTPEVLSAAGFYHIPSEEKPDRVKCAYCDNKLYNWKFDDDPLIVHANAFPYCPYMEACIGKDVLNNLQSQKLPRDANTHPRNIEDTDLNQSSSANPERTSSSSTLQPEDALTKQMRSEPVRAVIEMGFSEDLVRQIMDTCVIERRAHLPSGQELASMVMELEHPSIGEAVARAPPPMTPLQKMMLSGHTNRQTSGIPQAAGTTTQKTKHLGNTGVVSNGSETLGLLREQPSNKGLGASSSAYQNSHGETQHKWHASNHHGYCHATSNTIRFENERLKDQFLCKICMEVTVSVTFVPCGHLACCATCSTSMSECPICRSVVLDRVNTYI